jgi:hypothetical protein
MCELPRHHGGQSRSRTAPSPLVWRRWAVFAANCRRASCCPNGQQRAAAKRGDRPASFLDQALETSRVTCAASNPTPRPLCALEFPYARARFLLPLTFWLPVWSTFSHLGGEGKKRQIFFRSCSTTPRTNLCTKVLYLSSTNTVPPKLFAGNKNVTTRWSNGPVGTQWWSTIERRNSRASDRQRSARLCRLADRVCVLLRRENLDRTPAGCARWGVVQAAKTQVSTCGSRRMLLPISTSR